MNIFSSTTSLIRLYEVFLYQLILFYRMAIMLCLYDLNHFKKSTNSTNIHFYQIVICIWTCPLYVFSRICNMKSSEIVGVRTIPSSKSSRSKCGICWFTLEADTFTSTRTDKELSHTWSLVLDPRWKITASQ